MLMLVNNIMAFNNWAYVTKPGPASQRVTSGEKQGLQMGMLGGWYSDPGEQQPVKKTASVRVDTALGPEWHVARSAPSAQAQVQAKPAAAPEAVRPSYGLNGGFGPYSATQVSVQVLPCIVPNSGCAPLLVCIPLLTLAPPLFHLMCARFLTRCSLVQPVKARELDTITSAPVGAAPYESLPPQHWSQLR
jgi:hypothetical protein